MGCDIHAWIEVKNEDGTWSGVEQPYISRSYGLFGLLANVRNYSHVPSIAESKGVPVDASEEYRNSVEYWDGDGHSHSYLTLEELLNYNYNQVFWNRRVTKQIAPNYWNGASLAEEGEGTHEVVKAFIGENFFKILDQMKSLGSPDNVRLCFFFDN